MRGGAPVVLGGWWGESLRGWGHADPYGMTNERATAKGKGKSKIQGSFPFGKLRVRMTGFWVGERRRRQRHEHEQGQRLLGYWGVGAGPVRRSPGDQRTGASRRGS